MTKLKIAFFMVLLPFCSSKAQNDTWLKWENHTNTQLVSDICIDGEDVWATTLGGVYKCNTSTKTNVFYNRGNSNIPDNVILSIEKAADGTFWMGSQHYGISSFDGTTFTKINYETSYVPRNQWNTSIDIDSEGNIWFSSIMFVNKYDGTKWEEWQTGGNSSSNIINDIFIDKNDIVWVAGEWGVATIENNILKYFDEVTGYIDCITSDNLGNIWMAGKNNTLIKYNNNEFEYIDISCMPDDQVYYSIAIDTANTVWLGTRGGLVKYSNGVDTFYPMSVFNPGIFNKVAALEFDNKNNLWVGTSNGLFVFNGDSFEHVIKRLSNFPFSYRIIDIEYSENTVYLASSNGGLFGFFENDWFIYDSIDNPVRGDYNCIASNTNTIIVGGYSPTELCYLKENELIGDSNFIGSGIYVYDILPIGNDGYWLATNVGLYKYEANKTTLFNTDNSSLTSNHIKAIKYDTDGNLHGIMGAGLFKFDNSTIIEIEIDLMTGMKITKLEIDAKNNIWTNYIDGFLIGGESGNGILKFDGVDWTNYNTSNSDIPGNSVFAIEIDELDNLWIGTHGKGLAKFDNSEWTVYNVSNSGLAHNDINSLKKLPDGNLWIGHWTGQISVFNTGIVSVVENEIHDSELLIYPNPTSNKTNIKVNKKANEHLSVAIFDISGRLYGNIILEYGSSQTEIELSLSNFGITKTGIYVLKVKSGEIVNQHKILYFE